MSSAVALKFEINGHTVVTQRGRVTLTPLEMSVVVAVVKGGRVCVANMIERYSVMTPHERTDARRNLNAYASQVRKKLRNVGLDIVTIRGWGYRLGEVKSINARCDTEEPTHSEKEMLKAAETGKRAPASVALTDFDRERIRNLNARGLSLTGIASMIRKPHAAIAAELGML